MAINEMFVTLEHKTSHKCLFFVEIYTSSENRINQFVMIRTIFEKGAKKNLNIEEIYFKVVQIKLLAIHIIINNEV